MAEIIIDHTVPKIDVDDDEIEFKSSITIQAIMVFLLALFFGIVASAYILPRWLPNIANSFLGTSPKAYWFMSRGTGFVSLGLLWASMMFGIGITNKMARLWPGIPSSMAMHEYTGLLGLFFATFHGLILLGDKYSNYRLAQLLMPFGSTQYRPVWVALGQLGFYAWFIIVLTFYLRKHLGKKTWRVVHFFSFICYLGAVIHGLTSGTDAASTWALAFYWVTGGSFLFLLVYRVLTSRKKSAATTRTLPARG
jgi:predicted ferric reductase